MRKLVWIAVWLSLVIATVCYGSPNLWSYEIQHAKIPQPDIPVFVNGELKDQGNLLTIHHQVKNTRSWPVVFVLYSSGYLRLTPATEPATNFGTSIVLGPGYWERGQYYHNPALSEIRVVGDLKTDSELKIFASGRQGKLKVEYEITLNGPSAEKTSCRVVQKVICNEDFSIDKDHQANHEGFKLVQFSSMYINDYYHDGDALHFVGQSGHHKKDFADRDGFIFETTDQLAEPWLEMAHFAKTGWQGKTPSVSIILDELAIVLNSTPQGWITKSTDYNNDNVGAWINWDKAPINWHVGDTLTTVYDLQATNKPRE